MHDIFGNKRQIRVQRPKKHKKNVYTKNLKFRKVDIFVVNVGISYFRSLKSKKRCQIRIQRVEKHTKISFSEKKFFHQKGVHVLH